jgi:hypothetical protein
MSASQVTAVTAQGSEDQSEDQIAEQLGIGGEEQGEQRPKPGLTGVQLAALGAIREGSSFQDAAQTAGVNRTTVYRWIKADPDFRAAYNCWQEELRESARARLLKISEKAVSVVEKSLDFHNGEKVAVAILRDLGLLKSSAGGMTTPKAAAREIQVEVQENAWGLDARAMKRLFEESGLNQSQRARLMADYVKRELPPT